MKINAKDAPCVRCFSAQLFSFFGFITFYHAMKFEQDEKTQGFDIEVRQEVKVIEGKCDFNFGWMDDPQYISTYEDL